MGKRINRCIELLEQDQAIYYDGPHSGHVLTYAQGRIDAAHLGRLHECRHGARRVRHGGPGRISCAAWSMPARRDRGIARRPSSSRRRSTASTPLMCATMPGSFARSSAAACMASCCARRKPPTRCGPSSNPAAIRTTPSASIPRSRRRWRGWKERGGRRGGNDAAAASCSASARADADRKARRRRSGACRPKSTWSAAIPGRSIRKANCCWA